TVLHSFNSADGAHPEGSLIFDSSGNLYGTTSMGGSFAVGTVFELSPGPHGTWTEKMLHSLRGTDGAYPYGGLAFDTQGNLYGTAYQGGHHSQRCYYGCGSVFEVSPIGNGQGTGKAIYLFRGNDGSAPFSTPVFDSAGSLYGTTTGFSSPNPGNVFKLTPDGTGNWTETVLHNFTGADGYQPYAGLIFDSTGNLYGTTYQGGTAGFAGTVFELTPGGTGNWTETVLHSFNNSDGSFVYAGVVFDSLGNLWGTTSGYGSDLGSIYKLTPNGGTWTITVLHTFHDIRVNGGVAFDAAGTAYSTSYGGGNLSGCDEGCGMVFQVTPQNRSASPNSGRVRHLIVTAHDARRTQTRLMIFYSTPIPISNPFSGTDGLMVKNNTTPCTGEITCSRVSPNKSPTVPICSPSFTTTPGA